MYTDPSEVGKKKMHHTNRAAVFGRNTGENGSKINKEMNRKSSDYESHFG